MAYANPQVVVSMQLSQKQLTQMAGHWLVIEGLAGDVAHIWDTGGQGKQTINIGQLYAYNEMLKGTYTLNQFYTVFGKPMAQKLLDDLKKVAKGIQWVEGLPSGRGAHQYEVKLAGKIVLVSK